MPSGGVSALRMVGCGLDLRQGHTKDNKNDNALPRHSLFGGGIGGWDHPMIPGCSNDGEDGAMGSGLRG